MDLAAVENSSYECYPDSQFDEKASSVTTATASAATY